ncbi:MULTISPECIES: hypothetical protein [Arthrospira]|uniref:Uncharacterized protein n=1 Tax=Limnospira platensis NIES-46 TaxID=1236695 RepID=A0A5M3TER0_LIMPL|nr:hypothetical protein [Arthrospira platensis]MDF2208480.1 hypothetical protein [Arthrospira platensis NCB002]MDT9185146.1 hypothetical protein [Limnospira sp. PMC 289.06]MDT9297649.1 hypothetical protein [Arthrospira platensis PCC 7345]MDT9312844.1 hypothetical protein [Limnospira sp. Paracas R14]WAK74079.1 hypothetical protein AP9108_36685 [Arthrospira sp. PCC 9108]BDT16190.1 hypothetical protein N39L_59130 [Arthrospira platensis NIES-39]
MKISQDEDSIKRLLFLKQIAIASYVRIFIRLMAMLTALPPVIAAYRLTAEE